MSHHIPALDSIEAVNDNAAEALKLRQAVTDAQEGRRKAVDIGNESLARWRDAKAESEAAAVRNDLDLDAQEALFHKATALEKLAAHHVVTGRIKVADDELTRATNAFSMFCRRADVLDDLIEPHVQEAVEATEALTEALKLLAPVQERWNTIARKIHDVTTACHPQAAPGQVLDLSRYRIPTSPALPLPLVYTEGEAEPVERVEAPEPVKSEPALIVGRA